MLTSRNQRICKLISSAEFLEVHQNIKNWFRFLFLFFYFCGFRFRFEKEAYIYCGQITWEILFAFKFSNKKVPTHVMQELSSLFFVFLVACLIRLVENSCNEFYN